MPFDDAKFDAPASQGDVGRVAVIVALALIHIRESMRSLRNGEPVTEDRIKGLDAQIKKLDEYFIELTGYRK